ncbi:MAG: glycosyltransferase family 9 protein [Verrucomicrobiota bacterium]|jgi:ADP-heptose:LPS heptosyltransferase|nr:glycosyltransferase family 9 protein [Verrucomicrobiota bacterium]
MIEPASVGPPRILVIRGGAIGDFILTLPVLAALQDRFPQADIEVLGYPRIASLALSGGLARAVHALESPGLAAFFARDGSSDPEWREFFGQFAIVISYLYDPDGLFETNVKSCGPQQFIAAPHRPDERRSIHASEVFLKPLERLTIFDGDPVARLELSGLPKRENTLALHPGSGSPEKNWPERNWHDLLIHLLDHSPLEFLLVGGEAEGDLVRNLAKGTPAGRVQVAQHIPLHELASRLANCSGYIGHDTGVTHLASALALPTLVLWGPSNETVWRPLGEKVRVLNQHSALAELTLETVVEGINTLELEKF